MSLARQWGEGRSSQVWGVEFLTGVSNLIHPGARRALELAGNAPPFSDKALDQFYLMARFLVYQQRPLPPPLNDRPPSGCACFLGWVLLPMGGHSHRGVIAVCSRWVGLGSPCFRMLSRCVARKWILNEKKEGTGWTQSMGHLNQGCCLRESDMVCLAMEGTQVLPLPLTFGLGMNWAIFIFNLFFIGSSIRQELLLLLFLVLVSHAKLGFTST